MREGRQPRGRREHTLGVPHAGAQQTVSETRGARACVWCSLLKLLTRHGVPSRASHGVGAQAGCEHGSAGEDTAQHEGRSRVQRARGVATADGYACSPSHGRLLAYTCWHSPPAGLPWAKGSPGLHVAAARGVNATPLPHTHPRAPLLLWARHPGLPMACPSPGVDDGGSPWRLPAH